MRFNVTITDIFDLFQSEHNRGRVVAFHYAGHANSFQLLLEDEQGGNQSAHAEGLISFLAKQDSLKLAMLNGCSTEAQAQGLALANIATIATNNSIDDAVATQFAIRFYTALVNKASIHTAFTEAHDFVITHKGTANMRDLYWDGMERDGQTDEVPWEFYAPESWEGFREWTITSAFEALNITLAEKARKSYLEAGELGELNTLAIAGKLAVYLKNGRTKSALSFLKKQFINTQTPHYQYLLELRQTYSEIAQSSKIGTISAEQIDQKNTLLKTKIQALIAIEDDK